jgi:hypothetical protein
VLGPADGFAVVVVLVAGSVRGNRTEESPTVWPCTLSGRSSWCTTTSKAAMKTTVAVAELHCTIRR